MLRIKYSMGIPNVFPCKSLRFRYVFGFDECLVSNSLKSVKCDHKLKKLM